MYRYSLAALTAAIVGAAAIVILLAPLGEAWQRTVPPPETAPPREATPREPGEETRRAVPRSEAPERREPEAERRTEPRAADRADAQRRAVPRGQPPRRAELPRRYYDGPRRYYFPPIDVRLGFYYHPYFGFYYGPYYGPYYPYPGPYVMGDRYSASAIRVRVKPVETHVYVNGYYAGIADDFDGVFQRLHLPAGQHHLEFHLDGYRSFSQDLYITPGHTFDIVHVMQPLRLGERGVPLPAPRAVPEEWTQPVYDDGENSPASPYGILAIRTNPADSRILVDGEAWAPVEGQAEFVLHLSAGWHQLDVTREGYRPFSTKFELSEGETTRLDVRLTR